MRWAIHPMARYRKIPYEKLCPGSEELKKLQEDYR